MPQSDVLEPALDGRVVALRDAVAQLLAGYAEVARRLPEFGAPQEVEDALLGPLRQAAHGAATVLYRAAG